MADHWQGNAAQAHDAEVGMLVGELISEIGATRLRPKIHELALRLQSKIDEREKQTGRRIFS